MHGYAFCMFVSRRHSGDDDESLSYKHKQCEISWFNQVSNNANLSKDHCSKHTETGAARYGVESKLGSRVDGEREHHRVNNSFQKITWANDGLFGLSSLLAISKFNFD